MVDIGRRAVKVTAVLRVGCQGVGALDAQVDAWKPSNKDYAIITDVTPDPEHGDAPYFDHSRWRSDMVDLVMKLMEDGGPRVVYRHCGELVKVTSERPRRRVFSKWVAPGTIVVHLTRANEIEIYRAKLPEGKMKKLPERRKTANGK